MIYSQRGADYLALISFYMMTTKLGIRCLHSGYINCNEIEGIVLNLFVFVKQLISICYQRHK